MIAKFFGLLASLRRFGPQAVVVGLLSLLIAAPLLLCGEQFVPVPVQSVGRVPLATGGRYSNLAQELLKGKTESHAQPAAAVPPPQVAPPAGVVSQPPERPAVTIVGDSTMRSGVVLRPSQPSVGRPPVTAADRPAFTQPVPRAADPRPVARPSDAPQAAIVVKDAPRHDDPRVGLSIGTPTANRGTTSPPTVVRKPNIRQDVPCQDERMLTWNGADNPRPAQAAPPLAFGTLVPTQASLSPPGMPYQPPSTERAVAPKTVAALDPMMLVIDSEPLPPGIVPAPDAPVNAAADPKPATPSLPPPTPPQEVAVALPPLPPIAVAAPNLSQPPVVANQKVVNRPMASDIVTSRVEPPKPTPNGYVNTESLQKPATGWAAPPQFAIAEPRLAPPVMLTPRPTPPPQFAVAEPRPAPTPPPQVAVTEPRPAPIPPPQVAVAEPRPAPTPPPQVAVTESRPAPTPPPQVAVTESRPAPIPPPQFAVAEPRLAPTPPPQVAVAEPRPTPTLPPQVAVTEPKPAPVATVLLAEPPRLVAQLPPQAAAPSQARPVNPVPPTPPAIAPRREVAATVPPPRSEKPAPLPETIQDIEAGISHSSRYARQPAADNDEAGFSHSSAFR